MRVLVAGLAAPLAVSSAALVGVAAASAAGDAAGGLVTFTVDSLALNDPAADCGDRSKRCTLRNALAAAEVIGADRDVRIEVASQLWDGANLVSEGNIPFPTDAGEIEEAGVSLTPWDKGAVFRVTRPLELDLGRRVHLIPPDGEDTSLVGVKEAAGLVVEAEDVRLRNFSDWYSYQSAIVFSAAADRSSLAGGQSIQSENNHTNRQIVVMAGADGVSISDYRLGRESSAADGAAIALTRLTSSTGAVDTVSNLTVDDVVFDNTPSAPANSTCNSTDGTGCSADGLYLHGSVKVDGLTVQNSVFQGFRQSGRQPIDAAAAGEMTNWEIRRNRFTDIQIKANDSNSATVLLKAPSGSRPGPVRVHDNDFDNSATPAVQGPAIYFEGAEAAESTRPSGVFIEDNRFDGYNPTVKLLNGGAVTVRRNTFGAGTTSAAGTGTAEETGTSGVMVTNSGQPTNRGIWTWYPTAASLTPCGFEVAVTPNSGAAKKGMAPNMPADLDFYWTASKTAEVYLGSASVSRDEATTVMVKIPPSFASTTGRIRLQTQGAGASPDQPESSQFSRTVALDAAATCSSAVEIDLRAWTGVPPAATTHDAIIASGADELRPGDPFTAGADVWFTYTVRNAGRSDLIDVAVRDTQAGEVCVIPRIAPNATAGCARRAGPA